MQLPESLKLIFRQIYYHVGGWSTIQKAIRPWRACAVILCYHRVMPVEMIGTDESFHRRLAVPLKNFEEHMSYLAEHQNVVSMDEVAEWLLSDSNEFIIAVTFDDGYKDNLTHALPILKKYKIPATIYISSRFPEGECWMWWYELWDILLKQEILVVDHQGQNFQWKIHSLSEKNKCFNEMSSLLLRQKPDGLQNILTQLRKSDDVHDYREYCLTWEDIKVLDKEPLITIGAHTHSHHNLKHISEQEVISEMFMCKNLLERHLGHPIDHFAYPGGDPEWIGEREYRLAQSFGWKTAVTLLSRVDKPSPLQLPRILISFHTTVPVLRAVIAGWDTFWKR